MVLNAAVQLLREADELKQTILRFKTGTSMLQDHNVWATQQQLQKVYQKILILDLDYALEKKVEQDLWNVGFKQQIEALQAISKDRKNPLRSDAQAMLSWILQAAAGFYLCLLHQICTTFKLDLPFRRRASLLGAVEGWDASPGGVGAGGGSAGAGAARYASQHCLVHLGDLARYRQQLRLAHTFYRHALAVSPHSGQPYNQLALVWWRRGRRLCAVYWHVRSLLVRAPFPPAPANLARTLAAAVATPIDNGDKDSPLPVLPGVSPRAPARRALAERIDAHSYCHELLRALHYIHSVEQLDTATSLVENLNWSLTPLVATDSFDSMTLIKMTCVLIWAVQSSSEGFLVAASALSSEELAAARLADSLAAACVLALLLPAANGDEPPRRALPALKVWLQWLAQQPALCRSAAWRSRPQLWGAVAHALSALAVSAHALTDNKYDTVPLPEDEELQGFLPIDEGFKGLKFASRASWDAYTVPELEANDDDTGPPADPWSAAGPEREHRERARRLLRLGEALAARHPDQLTCTTDQDGKVSFEASALGGEQLTLALAELSAQAAVEDPAAPPAPTAPPAPAAAGLPPPPVVISEADFREKVREKRVGILKPQGSLERAREERALHGAAQPQEAETSDDSGKSEERERKEIRKPRVNIAMAAIMRKQEETNKQVKFVTPPPTPDSSVDTTETPTKEPEKPKVIQPKAMKSLANLPVGRKTGGILSLKDKSGYPHLVNVDPEPKKPDKEEKLDKPSQSSQNSQQSYQKRDPAPPAWTANGSPQSYNDVRMNFQKNYGIQAGVGYNPTYPAPGPASPPGQFIKLPVVNPKEIDVRTAALQKQNSRQDMFQEPNKFYQLSDKMNFLNDLPPRFANQYRYWHAAQDGQLNENKFRDEGFKTSPNYPEGFPQPSPWWKPDNQPLFNPTYSNVQMNSNVPNYYSVPANVPSPYQQSVQYNPPASTQNKNEKLPASYLSSAVGSLVSSAGYNPSNFGYSPTMPYDSAMYPQFGNKLGYPPYQGEKTADGGLNFGANLLDQQQRSVNFGEPFKSMSGAATTSDQLGQRAGVEPGGYSLFSAQQSWPAARNTAQSLWSGSQSPLERLLEQQKQKKPQ